MLEGLAVTCLRIPVSTSERMTRARHIGSLKAKGGEEQGDHPVPMLFSLGMHPALRAVQARLRPSERIFAFLDDVCVVYLPERVQTVVSILAVELWNHAHIQVHDVKTQVWNRASEEPVGIFELTARARIQDPNTVAWEHRLVATSS